MSKPKPNLGIQRVYGIELYVREAVPWLAYLTEGFGFQLIAASTGAETENTGTRSRLLRCGEVCIILSEEVHVASSVRRYLERHPEGIARVHFHVKDLKRTEQHLLEHHATPTDFSQTTTIGEGSWRSLNIATPLGDVEFSFIQCTGDACLLMSGMEPAGHFDPQHDPIGLARIDHMTANMRTLMPTVAFFEHVMGFTRQWDVQFHTEGLRPGIGTGLKSIVMWDEESGVSFANNEPLRPRFAESQVQLCVDANRGPGIGHLAFEVEDIIAAVDHCRREGVEFLTTPEAYYRALPGRITSQGIGSVSQPLEELQSRHILLDGDKNGYLLQVFCEDRSDRFARPDAGPLCLELIQRCGATGFGEGNFRALFEAMTRQQDESAKT